MIQTIHYHFQFDSIFNVIVNVNPIHFLILFTNSTQLFIFSSNHIIIIHVIYLETIMVVWFQMDYNVFCAYNLCLEFWMIRAFHLIYFFCFNHLLIIFIILPNILSDDLKLKGSWYLLVWIVVHLSCLIQTYRRQIWFQKQYKEKDYRLRNNLILYFLFSSPFIIS